VEQALDLARQQWAEGHRRVGESRSREPQLHARLLAQIEIVTAELKRRIGNSFTMDELADAYSRADRWPQEAIEERGSRRGWIASATTASDAAFHVYSRSARDYTP
jgi:hypothetical protein